MDQDQLHKLLDQLHTEILAARPVDEASRARLQRLAQDIRAVLDAKRTPASAEPYHAMRPKLQDAVVGFEASHPQLTKTIEKVIDTLALYNL